MTSTDDDLEKKFHVLMASLYQRTEVACRYRPTYFRRMVDELRGLGAARALLHAVRPAAGLTTLWEKGRLDLSVEATVLQAPWSSLFTEEERATARKRLRDLGYEA